jgi:hypothetical protein
MESISTLRSARLPWAANIATLAVVVMATWWSSAQRPAQAPIAQIGTAAQPAQPSQPVTQPANASQRKDGEPIPLRVQAPSTDATLVQASLRTVAYKPGTAN